jgi:hypothetical protein
MMPDDKRKEGQGRAGEDSTLSRRSFLQIVGAAPVLGAAGLGGSPQSAGAQEGKAAASKAYFTFVNHWHQSGLGWYLREGEVAGKHYTRAFSAFYDTQKDIDAVERFPYITVCLEYDSHSYEVMLEDDPQFVKEKLLPLVNSGRIELTGGTYTQAYGQLVGWQSNVRQFVEGRAVAREVMGKEIECFLVEEIIFFPQVPQLLKLCGFTSASLQVQNNGSLPVLHKALVNWRGLDGSMIPTIPNNPWMISLVNQYQSLAKFDDAEAEAQAAMLTIWAEIWPPGLDWGASYLPYAEGIESLHKKGLQSVGLSEYMRRRFQPGTKLDTQYWKMDDGALNFGWPQNKGAIWATMGGWGYDGDALPKENRRLEHELNALELLLSVTPDAQRSRRLRDLWKRLMLPQAHDCFIVSRFPAQYHGVKTSNLEVCRMMWREIEADIRQLQGEVAEDLAGTQPANALTSVVCQNPSGVAVRQPVVLDLGAGNEFDYSLENGEDVIPLQRIEPDFANENPKALAVVDLPPCGFKTFAIKKGSAASKPALPASGEISNDFHSVKWDERSKGFAITDKGRNQTLVFRPFSGPIVHVLESGWRAPNSGEKFRAKDFSEVTYHSSVEAAGPVYSALAARGNILTFNTVDDPGAWVTARAMLYKGVRRVDLFAELHTYPNMEFRALAELEVPGQVMKACRDFPFGDEEGQKDQFSALNYVRLESSGFATLLAHGGTQQFFCLRNPGKVVLRNMIARLTLQGSYRWNWSLTTGASFSPVESFRFAEAAWGPIVLQGASMKPFQSWLSVNDPAVVVFRLGAEPDTMTVWLMNYSDAPKQGVLTFAQALRGCVQTDLEGKPLPGGTATLDTSGKKVEINLAPWQIAALDLSTGAK